MIGSFGIIGSLIVLYSAYIAMKKSYKDLFKIVIFTSILTTTSVIDLKGTSITVPLVVGAIYIGRVCFDIFYKKVEFSKLNKYIYIFVAYAIGTSLIAMTFSKGYLAVGNHEIAGFGFGMIKQLIYLIHSVLVLQATVILVENKKITLKLFDVLVHKLTYILGGLAVFQLITPKVFYFLLKNRKGQAFIHTLENGDVRVTTTFNEPSMFAGLIILLLGYFIFKYKFDKKNIGCILILLICGLLTKSSSFILGFMVIATIFLWSYSKKFKKKQLLIYFLGLIGSVCLVNILLKGEIVNQLDVLINKVLGGGVSGSIRLESFSTCFQIFLRFSITGVGFGINRSADLLSTLLANVGLSGILILGGFIYYSLIKKADSNKRHIQMSLIGMGIVLLVSIPEIYYSYIWIFIGILGSTLEKEELS